MAHREAVRGVHAIRLIRFGVCGLMRWRFSDGELIPFSKRRRTVLLEDIAAVEVLRCERFMYSGQMKGRHVVGSGR